MISRIRLRLLADYIAATRNEIAVDEMFLALSKVNAVDVGYFPRVPHWIIFAKRQPNLVRLVFHIARMVWLAGGAAIFFVLEYFKFRRLHRMANAEHLPRHDGAILYLSKRVGDVLKPTQFPAFPRTWFTLPWVPLQGIPKGVAELPMLSVLRVQDLREALVDAMIVTRRMRREQRLSPWVLQTYTAFRWFLVRRALNFLSGTLVTAEHYDRWAVLVDRTVREQRRASCSTVRLVLVQHGAMTGLNQELPFQKSFLQLPTRLRQVDELHVYNSNEAAAFQAHVFAPGGAVAMPEVCFFKPLIELRGASFSERQRLLFVGHPLCEGFQIEIFRRLKACRNVEVYYKPHPTAPMSKLIEALDWVLIRDVNHFPRVDLLVSYPSTLVIEYEGVGIPASVHPLAVAVDDAALFFEKTLAIIDGRLENLR